MNGFCDQCYCVLEFRTENGKEVKVCTFCRAGYPITAADTLRYDNQKFSSTDIYLLTSKHAKDDPTAQKIERACKKCAHPFARRKRVGDKMLLFMICIKCGYQELYEDTDEIIALPIIM